MKSYLATILASLMVCTWTSFDAVADDQEPTTPPAGEAVVEQTDAAEESNWKSAASLSYYYDTREYSTLTIFTSVQGLPLGLSLWGFTDIHGDQEAGDPSDFTRYFMEYRLSRDLDPDWVLGIKGLGLMAEFNDFNGSNNNLARFGPYYSTSFELPWKRQAKFQCRVFVYETDGQGWQCSMSYNVPFTDRLSLTGFADINFVENGTDQWVIEPQLNYMLDEHFSIIVEMRYNGFEDANANLDGFGVAGGLCMKL